MPFTKPCQIKTSTRRTATALQDACNLLSVHVLSLEHVVDVEVQVDLYVSLLQRGLCASASGACKCTTDAKCRVLVLHARKTTRHADTPLGRGEPRLPRAWFKLPQKRGDRTFHGMSLKGSSLRGVPGNPLMMRQVLPSLRMSVCRAGHGFPRNTI